MDPAGVPGRDPLLRVERVRESAHTGVTRLYFPDRTVIRKQPLGPDADRRLRQEVAMLQRLRGVDGVAQLVDALQYPGSIVLADAGGRSLAGLVKPLAQDELTELATALARAVARMHRSGVMHRDITPANIVLAADGTPTLVDFALAAPVAELRPGFAPPAEIVGTLPYLAPESTGRTGRPVDHRADLYALGATLYEAATGAPPFATGDPLALIHHHLARVPVAPVEVHPAIPASLSQIILHLLEKEPDHRYQTADGLLFDLEQLRDAGTPSTEMIRVGAHDLPLRLLPPSRLVGREDEVAALEEAFEDALAGRCRGVLVGGAPGVGKTALVDQLRPMVAGRDGWFVAGKFDQYRRDLEFDAVHQAFRGLGRLLLAEPENELAQLRARILAALGPNAGLVTAAVPEFATLLAVPPEPGDPLTAQGRAQRTAEQALRAIASRKRPVVVFVDDLQWAGRSPVGAVDLVLGEEPVEGLLLVCAYREADVDATHPLAAPLSRWREQTAVRHLRLENLPAPRLRTMVAEMLHVTPAAVAALVEVIEPHTSGNPYETVELLDALRRDGLLTATPDGWRWDAAAVATRLGDSELAGLSAARVAAMPASSRELVEAMACLGGRVEPSLLQVATGKPVDVMEQMLAPALDDGPLLVEPGARQALRFRHDRLREVILGALEPPRRRALQLGMARRLAGVPELFAVAAEQYLPVADSVDDAGERRRVVGLLRRAADEAALIGDHVRVSALLAAALRLIDPGDVATLIEMHTARHGALFCGGRLEEADDEYRTIEQLSTSVLERADATCVQVRSLTHRNLFTDAIGLGLGALRELGITVPAPERLAAELDRQFGHLYRWLDDTEAADDLVRPETADPTLVADGHLIDAVVPAVFFAGGHAMYAWLSLESLRIWLQYGPGRALASPASLATFAVVPMRGDYGAGYRAAQRIVAFCEARGYEPETSRVRCQSAFLSCWFEPIENGVSAVKQAREGLIAGGDLVYAGYSYQIAVFYLLDCAPTLDVFVAEADAALDFERRSGSEHIGQLLDSYRWLAGVLRGQNTVAADEAVPADRYAGNPPALVYAHVNHAVAAAVFGDPDGLTRHTAAAMAQLPAIVGVYPTASAHLLRGLSLAWQARDRSGAERAGMLSELDDVTAWVAARAADAPDNFSRPLRLLEAERAWTLGEHRTAELAFDAARREVAGRHRPWHRALITERAARFHLAHGLEQTGYELLTQARAHYAAWGATAKVAQLDWAYPGLRPAAESTARRDGPAAGSPQLATVSTGTIDLLGILSASQALSSETSLERLHARVVEVLGALTGATAVHLLPWDTDRQDWLLSTPAGIGPARNAPASSTGHETTVPLSVLRYVQRTGEPLLVGDATVDDRFARDPYLAGADCCALLAVPIHSRGTLGAVLVLENRLLRGAFTTDRLDAVTLIAGQLAVSLDNAQLYEQLMASRARIVTAADTARRRIERDLHDGAQQRLVSLALQLRTVQADVPPEVERLRARLDDLAAAATSALDELRDIARGLHPAALARGGLPRALPALARRSPLPVHLDVRVDPRLPDPVELAAYYAVAEALTNAAKHARATLVDVTVTLGEDGLRIAVRDDGRGGADFAGGTGLLGLKDRIDALGGRMSLHSPRGTGTTLTITLPLDGSAAQAPLLS